MPFEISIDTKQFVEIEKKLRDSAAQILSGGDLKEEVGDFAVERIKYQARIGEPYNSSGSFPELKDSTRKNRRYLAKYNPTHPVFDVDFSNLTITGDLLESLTWVDEGDCLLKLQFEGEHSAYLGKRGQPVSEPIDNATLVEYLAAKGFFIFDLSLKNNAEFINRIKNIALGYIRRGLRVQSKLGQ